MTTIIVLSIVFVIIVLIIISISNGIIRKRNQVNNALGSVDAQLKKRYDLIPNLVETVKQYATHEKSILEEVTALRTRAMSGNISKQEKDEIDNKISRSISGIMVAVENYPDLKASENFINLQQNLTEVESQISAARRFYNTAVTEYNNSIETFPGNIIANLNKYQPMEVFEITEQERKNVNVKDLF